MEQYLNEKYKEESYELLAEMEASLLALENEPYNKKRINHILGVMHTIKGTASMFGFDNIALFIHEIETVFGCVRDGKLAVTKQLITLSLSACDQIKKTLEADSMGHNKQFHEIIKSFTDLLLSETSEDKSFLRSQTQLGNEMQECKNFISASKDEKPVTYKIRFCPSQDIFTTGTNPMRLLDELRSLGKCKVIADIHAIPCLKSLNPEDCHICWDILLTTTQNISLIREVFIFVEDDSEIRIEEAAPEETLKVLKTFELVPTLRVGTQGDDALHPCDSGTRSIPAAFPRKAWEQDEPPVLNQHDQSDNKKKNGVLSGIKVPAEKLDKMMDLVGELITFQAYLSQKSRMLKDAELYFIAEGVERIAQELRDNTMRIRMLPIGTIFNFFKRLVHDLAEELGKKIILTTEGDETELDKTIIEGVKEPLIHILRNSIDHGIEPPHIREASGKPEHGTIRLSASHIGDKVLIQISDDGAGIDLESVYKTAKEKGVFHPDAKISESEILEQIFIPGISTAKHITDISGRGIGMDVVKNCITDLHGTLNISTRKGKGTTLTLKLPLTLAIIDGLLVKVGDGNFVLPLSAIEECMELPPIDAARVRKQSILHFRGEIIPYFSLRKFFMTDGRPPRREWVVVIRVNGDIIGVGVDYIIGQHHTVIKSLSRAYKNVKAISGATILGDGTIALILDVNQLINRF